MERRKETKLEQSAETELPAQVAGFLGLHHPASPTCAETAARSVRFAPGRGREARPGWDAPLRLRPWAPTPAARPTTRSGERPAQSGPRSAGSAAPPRSRLSPGSGQLRSPLPAAKRKAFPSASAPPPGARRQLRPGLYGHRPPAGLTFAEQRQQQQQPQPRGAGRRRRLRHGPCAPGPRQKGCWLGPGSRRRDAVLSLAAPCPPGTRGTRGTLGAQSVGAPTPAALHRCAPGSGRGTEAGRARAAPPERAGAGRGGKGGVPGACRAGPECGRGAGGKGGARGTGLRLGVLVRIPPRSERRLVLDAGRRCGRVRVAARCRTRGAGLPPAAPVRAPPARPATLPQPVRRLSVPERRPFRLPREGWETTQGFGVWADRRGVRPSGPGG